MENKKAIKAAPVAITFEPPAVAAGVDSPVAADVSFVVVASAKALTSTATSVRSNSGVV